MRVSCGWRRNICAILLQFVGITKIVVVKVVVSDGRSFVPPALENIKSVNYEDRVIVAVVLIEI